MNLFHEFFGDPLKHAQKAKQAQREDTGGYTQKMKQGISYNLAYVLVTIPVYVGLTLLALFLGTGPIAYVLFSIIFMHLGRRLGWLLSKTFLYSAPMPLVFLACVMWGGLVAILIHALIAWQQPHLFLKIVFGFGLGAYVANPSLGFFDESTIPDHAMPRHFIISSLPLVTFIILLVVSAHSGQEQGAQDGKSKSSLTNAARSQRTATNDPPTLSPRPADATETIADLKTKAEKGDSEAQLTLGAQYALGLGVERNDSEATNWLTKALLNGQPNALVFLSEVYAEPDSNCFDQQKALEFTRRAANEGGVGLVLADIYDDAASPLYDLQRAFKITRRFAEAGDAMAKAELGVKFIEGTGVATNATEGVRWLTEGIRSIELATNTAKTPAQSFSLRLTAARYANRLGDYYDTGNFLPKDQTNSVSWFRHAAELTKTQ